MANETVTISKIEHELLIRESERLSIIKRLVCKERYMNMEDLKAIIGTVENEKNVPSFEDMLCEKEGEE